MIYENDTDYNKNEFGKGFCIQWKNTSVCCDIRCECGARLHFDVDFMYVICCPECQQHYRVGCHLNMYKCGPDEQAKSPVVWDKDGVEYCAGGEGVEDIDPVNKYAAYDGAISYIAELRAELEKYKRAHAILMLGAEPLVLSNMRWVCSYCGARIGHHEMTCEWLKAKELR